jgi:hypothetical protein
MLSFKNVKGYDSYELLITADLTTKRDENRKSLGRKRYVEAELDDLIEFVENRNYSCKQSQLLKMNTRYEEDSAHVFQRKELKIADSSQQMLYNI